MAADQPLKKRKIPDDLAGEPPPQRRRSPPAPTAEEVAQKRRNRDEIRSLVDCYRKIRVCVEKKDASLMPELEQSYLALITASRGCTTVQRIVAELIPRYASYCPTALEAAAKVSTNMYNWSLAIIMRGDDVDGVAYQTAKACVLGLVEICCTASYEASTSSVIQGICAAVFLNVLTFFISTIEGKDIYQMGYSSILKMQEPMDFVDDLKQEEGDANEPCLDKLFKLRALSLLCIFVSFPKNLLQSCFELIVSGGTDVGSNKGLYFLSQLTSDLNHVMKADASDEIIDGPSKELVKNSSADSQVDPISQHKIFLDNSLVQSSKSLLEMAIKRNSSLRGFIISKYKRLSESLSPQVRSELSSILDRVFGSVSDIVKEAEYEEYNKDNYKPSKCVDSSYLVHRARPQQDINVKVAREHPSGVHDGPASDAREWVSEYDERGSGQFSRPLPYKRDGTYIEEGDRLASGKTKRQNEDDIFPMRSFGSKESTRDQHHLERKKQLDAFSNDFQKQGHEIRSPSGGAAVGYMSEHSASQSHSSSLHQWHFDGDTKAMDVIYASRELWLSSLGPDASENSVRLAFEDFGSLENFFFFPAKDFALVEYRNVGDAVKAREYMQGSTLWGGCIKIKFLDRGLGTRGVINGVAFGDSRHVYIGKVSSLQLKDEILHGLMTAGLRNPRMVTDLISETALLLEFGTAEEAAAAIRHIRYQRAIYGGNMYPNESWPPSSMNTDKFASSSQLPMRNNRASMGYEEPHFTPRSLGVSGYFSPARMETKSVYTGPFPNNVERGVQMLNSAPVPQGQAFQMNWANTSNSSIYEVDSRQDESCISAPMDLSYPEGHSASQSGERTWNYKQLEQEPHSFSSNSEQGGPIAPPPPSIPASFAPPVYHTQTHTWDNSGVKLLPGQTSIATTHTDNRNINVRPPVPFIPCSITPLSQLAGCPIPSLPNIPPPPPVPSDVPPPLPSSPPPLPLSQPPAIPPPPSSPPPHPSSADSLNLLTSGSCPRQTWQGILSKSGIQYCTIYASRENSAICGYTNSISEPEEWPARLDVTKRTDFQHAKTTFTNTPPRKREVCRLLPVTKGDQKGIQDFTSYLKQRECVGVIKIPAVKTMWSRLLFILPYSTDTCSFLSISPHPADCLIALVLPKDANQE